MTETHTLQLQIDAKAADAGARKFAAAIATVRAAVQELDRDTTGAFTALSKIKTPRLDMSGLRAAGSDAAKAVSQVDAAAVRAATDIRRVMLAADAGLRQATTSAQKLSFRLDDLGDNAALSRLQDGLAVLKAKMETPADLMGVRTARNEYENLRIQITQAATAQENAIGIANRLAREQSDAASAAAKQAATLDTLRARFNPLYAASKSYERELQDIAAAERDGAISAQLAAQARDRAAQALTAGSVAADRFTMSAGASRAATANLAAQAQDVFVSWQMGLPVLSTAISQGLQASTVLNQMGGRKQVIAGLAGAFTSLLNPMTLGTVAVIALGGAIVSWMTSGSEATKSFADSLGDANSAVSALRQATQALAGATGGSMVDGYGRATAALRDHLAVMREIALMEATTKTADLMTSAQSEMSAGWWLTDLDSMRIAFDTTNDEARVLLSMLDQIKQARTFDDQVAALQRMIGEVDSITGGLDKSSGAGRTLFMELVKSLDVAMKLQAAEDGTADSGNRAASAASNLAAQLGTGADEAARLLVNLGSVPGALSIMGKSVDDQIAAMQAQNKSLSLQLSTGMSGVAADRRVQLDTMISTAGARGQRLNFDDIASQSAQIDALDAAAKAQAELQKALSDANKPAKGSGGGRAQSLGDESKQLKALSGDMNTRIFDLDRENSALRLLADGQAQTMEGAQMLADAQRLGSGLVDEQTAAMVRQYDAAVKLNEALKRAASDPVKDWTESVPGWTEAGRQIEIGVIGNLKDAIKNFAQTGKLDIESLGASIVASFAEVVANKATKELWSLLGSAIGGTGEGGFFGDLFGSMSMVFGAHKEGGLSTQPVGFASAPIAAFHNAPHYAQGTANTSGIPAVLHDNEAVIPLSKGRKVPVELAGGAGAGGNRVYAPTFNIQTPDADSFRASKRQILRDSAEAAARAMKDK